MCLQGWERRCTANTTIWVLIFFVVRNYKINIFYFEKGEQKKIGENKKNTEKNEECRRNSQVRRDEDGKVKKTKLEETTKK